MWENDGSALICSQTSYPSFSGMMMSHSTMSGRTCGSRSRASLPLPTVTTSKSSSEKVSSMTFWIVMLSSASRIFFPIRYRAPKACAAPRRSPPSRQRGVESGRFG